MMTNLKILVVESIFMNFLNRIKDIRLIYRQVLDLYVTAIDYDPKSLNSGRDFHLLLILK